MTATKPNQFPRSVILFNCREELKTYEEVNQKELQPINNFMEIIASQFQKYVKSNGQHINIIAPTYKAYCGIANTLTIGRTIDIYGEDGLHEFIALAKVHGWKIYDKNLHHFIDLSPSKGFFLLKDTSKAH